MPSASRKSEPRERGRARRHEPCGRAYRRMLPGHGFSCERHFLFPFRSVNGWKEAAGNAAPQAPRFPPPVLPNGGVRRGGSKGEERFGRASGGNSRVRRERAAGCRLRGKGAMSGKRQDLVCGLAVAGAERPGMAAGPALADAGSACAVARIELRLLVQGPGGALAWSPGTGPETPAASAADAASIAAPGPEVRGPVIPDWALSRRRVPRGRRTETACRGRKVCGPGTSSRGAGGRSCARRPGGTARGPKRHAESMGCVSIQGAREGFFRCDFTRDNCRYRESNVNAIRALVTRCIARRARARCTGTRQVVDLQ